MRKLVLILVVAVLVLGGAWKWACRDTTPEVGPLGAASGVWEIAGTQEEVVTLLGALVERGREGSNLILTAPGGEYVEFFGERLDEAAVEIFATADSAGLDEAGREQLAALGWPPPTYEVVKSVARGEDAAAVGELATLARRTFAEVYGRDPDAVRLRAELQLLEEQDGEEGAEGE